MHAGVRRRACAHLSVRRRGAHGAPVSAAGASSLPARPLARSSVEAVRPSASRLSCVGFEARRDSMAGIVGAAAAAAAGGACTAPAVGVGALSSLDLRRSLSLSRLGSFFFSFFALPLPASPLLWLSECACSWLGSTKDCMHSGQRKPSVAAMAAYVRARLFFLLRGSRSAGALWRARPASLGRLGGFAFGLAALCCVRCLCVCLFGLFVHCRRGTFGNA